MADRFAEWQPPEFDARGMTRWNWMCQHHANLRVGRRTDVGAFTYMNAKNGITIEDEVQVGSHCSIYTVSTIDDKAGPVTLRRNCRIGTHSTIMPGVTVGEDAVVGAYSFVTRDVPARSVAYGVPARVRKVDGVPAPQEEAR